MRALKLQINLVSNIDDHIKIGEFDDFSHQSRRQQHFITLVKTVDQLRMFFLTLSLWPDRREIHEEKQSNHHQEQERRITSLRLTSTLCVR